MLDAIRCSIERGDFAQAATLWEAWSRDLASRMAAGPIDRAEWTRTAELYHWSRDVLLCARVRFLDRLNTLHAAEAYGAQQLLGVTNDLTGPRALAHRAATGPAESSALNATR